MWLLIVSTSVEYLSLQTPHVEAAFQGRGLAYSGGVFDREPETYTVPWMLLRLQRGKRTPWCAGKGVGKYGLRGKVLVLFTVLNVPVDRCME